MNTDVESDSGAKKTNFLAGPIWEKFFEFCFLMAHSGVLYIFERQRGPKHRGAREKLSPFPLSTGLLMNTDMILEATASTLS